MLYGIIMLYVLRCINAPQWCFILDWFLIISNALIILLRVWATSLLNKYKEKKDL